MKNRSQQASPPIAFRLDFWWLIVAYAVIDVVCSWIRVQRFVADAISSEVSLIGTPLTMMSDSLLLMAAAISGRIAKRWGNLAAIGFAGWLLYRCFQKWALIAAAIEAPATSWSVLSYWWSYANAAWDFPRFAAGAAVFVYALIRLNRFGWTLRS